MRQVIYEPDQEFHYVYFIEEGLCSIVTVMDDGTSVEVGMVGNDGMAGFGALLIPGQASSTEVIVQVPGKALKIDFDVFKAAFDEREGIRRVVFRCIGDAIMLGAQTAACNRLHSMEQRLARWLLMVSDRVGSDTLTMTHEFLSQMLGVRRSGVTMVCGELQRSGLISYRHGMVTILNHEGLEALSCECYRLDHERLTVPVS
jgi:CRP-like cAMP-binding protein